MHKNHQKIRLKPFRLRSSARKSRHFSFRPKQVLMFFYALCRAAFNAIHPHFTVGWSLEWIQFRTRSPLPVLFVVARRPSVRQSQPTTIQECPDRSCWLCGTFWEDCGDEKSAFRHFRKLQRDNRFGSETCEHRRTCHLLNCFEFNVNVNGCCISFCLILFTAIVKVQKRLE